MEITRENLLTLIKSGIKRDALSVSGLEKVANVPKDTVRDFLRGKTQILRADKLQKILRILEPQDTVHIAGFVGAKGEITFTADGAKDIVVCPPECDPCDVVAVRVRGDSMQPLLPDGAIIYFSRRSDIEIPVLSGGWQVPYEKTPAKGKSRPERFAEFLGRPCVVGLEDSRAFVGTLKASGSAYDLVHYSDGGLKNITPLWAAKIIFIKTE